MDRSNQVGNSIIASNVLDQSNPSQSPKLTETLVVKPSPNSNSYLIPSATVSSRPTAARPRNVQRFCEPKRFGWCFTHVSV
jgi:hypothetical protein